MALSKTIPAEVLAADRDIEELRSKAELRMKDVESLLVGSIVSRHDGTYKVTRAFLSYGKHIDLKGVRLNGAKVGTREFHIGFAILCEFIAPRPAHIKTEG